VDNIEVRDNRTNLEKLDEILEIRMKNDYEEREMEPDEINKLEDWEKRKALQNKELGNMGQTLKQVKAKAKNIGEELNDMGKIINKTTKMANKTEANLKSTNQKMKDLLNKLRSGDKICVDIILVCVCLGLIAILYNLIKSNVSSNSAADAAKNTTLLFI